MSDDKELPISPEDGLTDHERQYLTTPLKDLTPDQRMTSMAIKDKKIEFVRKENDKFTEEYYARRRKEKADEQSAA